MCVRVCVIVCKFVSMWVWTFQVSMWDSTHVHTYYVRPYTTYLFPLSHLPSWGSSSHLQHGSHMLLIATLYIALLIVWVWENVQIGHPAARPTNLFIVCKFSISNLADSWIIIRHSSHFSAILADYLCNLFSTSTYRKCKFPVTLHVRPSSAGG